MKPQGYFTLKLWQAAQPVLNKILSCRFVNGLADGTLPFPAFAHYLTQDVLYLKQDNEALTTLSEKLSHKEYKLFFQSLANDGIAMEEALHNEYLQHFNLQEARAQSPAFKAYGNFLVKHAHESTSEIAMAALLPCFWIYTMVGKIIYSKSVLGNKYQKFIDTYAGEEYVQYTIQYIKIIEETALNVLPHVKDEMENAFLKGCELELMVFEEAILST